MAMPDPELGILVIPQRMRYGHYVRLKPAGTDGNQYDIVVIQDVERDPHMDGGFKPRMVPLNERQLQSHCQNRQIRISYLEVPHLVVALAELMRRMKVRPPGPNPEETHSNELSDAMNVVKAEEDRRIVNIAVRDFGEFAPRDGDIPIPQVENKVARPATVNATKFKPAEKDDIDRQFDELMGYSRGRRG